jgi:hypothetical protein
MSKTIKRHLNRIPELVAAWDSGQPLQAVCGYSRITTEEEYDSNKGAPICGDCWKIARHLMSTASLDSIHGNLSAAQIRKAAEPPANYTFKLSGNTGRMTVTWDWPPAA